MIYVDDGKCAGCGVCEDVCPVEAVWVSDGIARIDQDRCNECQACVEACPNGAILVVIEPAEEKAISLREQPVPNVALAEPRQSKIVPIVGAVLAFLGREITPRLATYLLDALDRRLSQRPTLRQPFDPSAVSPTDNVTPLGGGKSGQRGRRRRYRRRGQ